MKRIGISLEDFKEVSIIPIADTHLGDPLFDRDKLDEVLYFVVKNDAKIMLLGDIITAELKHTIGNIFKTKLNPQEEIEIAIDIFRPLKDRIIGIVQGNHEKRIEKETGLDVSRILALELGLVDFYDPDSVLLDIKLGKNPHGKPYIYTILGFHGWGSGRKLGGKLDKAREGKNIVHDADVYVVGHYHSVFFGAESLRYYDKRTDKNYSLSQFIVGANGFLRYGDYSERLALLQQVCGITIINLSGRERRKSYQFISFDGGEKELEFTKKTS